VVQPLVKGEFCLTVCVAVLVDNAADIGSGDVTTRSQQQQQHVKNE